jgi:6-phosphogluconate dehydrogenase
MQLGVIGLGRMGGAIATRLMRGGHQCVVYDRDRAAVDRLVEDGAAGARDLADMKAKLRPPRAVWVMLPDGTPTDDTVAALGDILERGDTVIDGGNTFYRDDLRRAGALAPKGLSYIDVGTSGGVWGLERGFCMMVGGEAQAVARIEPILETLAPGLGDIPRTRRPRGSDPRAERGYIHAGPVGAGHFVKMIHNGVEYGLMQAYAEGFDILANKASDALPQAERYDLNLSDIAEVWRRGSVVASWLLDLTAQALSDDPQLRAFTGAVADSGEGRWTLQAALEEAVPADVLAAALFARFRSREDHTFGEKLLSAMRFGFGGHVEPGARAQGDARAAKG